MNVPPEYRDVQVAYRAGWAAALDAIRAANRSVPPIPREQLHTCNLCREPLEIGQPALAAAPDAYGHLTWVHSTCPTARTVPTTPCPPQTMTRVATLRMALDALRDPEAAPLHTALGKTLTHALTRKDRT